MDDAIESDMLPPLEVPLPIRAVGVGLIAHVAFLLTYVSTSSILWVTVSSATAGFVVWLVAPFVVAALPLAFIASDQWFESTAGARRVCAVSWGAWLTLGVLCTVAIAGDASPMLQTNTPELGLGMLGFGMLGLAVFAFAVIASAVTATVWFMRRRRTIG